jgi:hypothetical protein
MSYEPTSMSESVLNQLVEKPEGRTKYGVIVLTVPLLD